MVHDPGLGDPREANEDDFTKEELESFGFLRMGQIIRWRGEDWRVMSVTPLLLEELK